MKEVEAADKKICKYGSLKALKNAIKEKKKKNIDTKKLEVLAKEGEKAYKKVESEVGIKIDDIKSHVDPYPESQDAYFYSQE